MFGAQFSPTTTTRRTAQAFPARAVVAAAVSRGAPELERAREIADLNGVDLRIVDLDVADRISVAERVVTDAARDARTAFVVVGPQRQGSRRLAERLRLSGCAVLEVRNPADKPYSRIVIATDERSAVVEMTDAGRFVAPITRRIEYLHVFQSASEPILVANAMGPVVIRHYRRESRREARARLTRLLERAELDVSLLRLRHGRPASVLANVDEDSLLVIHRGSSWLEHAVFGSVTRTVLEEGRADVLVV